jgi:hypothetical protein
VKIVGSFEALKKKSESQVLGFSIVLELQT